MTRPTTILSANVNVACGCGARFVALFRPPGWQARCPKCGTLCSLAVSVTLEATR